MLDLKFVRENPDIVKKNIENKFQFEKLPLVDEVIELDAKNRAAKAEADNLRASRNKLSKQIGALMGQKKFDEANAVKAQVTADSERLAELEKRLDNESALRYRVRELSEKLETVRRENDALREPAAQYQSLKEHIAEIEISAHRRTEQFREEAVTQLRQLAARQREWCRTAQADYEQMNCQLLERLQQAEQTLRQPDMSSFRRMEEGLTALEKGLTAPEKAGE